MSETPSISIYESLFVQSDETDAILVVEGTKMHVNKTLLSFHSDYFNTLFNGEFKEKSMQEIPIEDVNFEDFAATLSLLYPSPIKPTDENVERLLEIADRFLIPSVKYSLELFVKTCFMDEIDKIRNADKFKFKDSPIDICALILYDSYLWKTTEKSYENYEKLCEAMGKPAFSFNDYKYWFKKYSKQRGRDDLPIPDIRGCILLDFINGKPAGKSMDDLCKAFKHHKINREDHDYWYKRFRNGHLFNPITFSDLPEDVITEIVERCDIKSYLQLRKVSSGLRSIVDHSKPPLTFIAVRFGENHVTFDLNCEVTVCYTDINGVNPSSYFGEHFYKFVDDDYAKVAFNYLEVVLKNPKLQLNNFRVGISNDTHNKSNQMFRDLLSSLSHKIHVEHIFFDDQKDEDIIAVLKCVKPGTLERLIVFGCKGGELSTIHELVEMEQWKQAKIFSSDQLLHTSIEHFFHFNEFHINIVSLSTEDVMNLSHAVSNSPDFKICQVNVKRYDQEAVMNALRLDQYNCSELYPNLVFYLSPNCIEIYLNVTDV
ncbi:hypothetical protein CRE_18284 [Caenorhabditis remanei]|uniref:F-box domain-containing protein n=1 Tax=Caenorhabditis remanei TaxID=31234 RepID=E3NKV7_CAERE|nr:hypothetical protein CRE_18284 [Caenorhabditis remanei]